MKAFITVAQGDGTIGKLRLSLRPDVVPKTVENFVHYLTAQPRGDEIQSSALPTYNRNNADERGYRNSTFHRIIPRFMAQGGDFMKGDGENKEPESILSQQAKLTISVVPLFGTQEPAPAPSMARLSRTRTLYSRTVSAERYRWRTPEKTQVSVGVHSIPYSRLGDLNVHNSKLFSPQMAVNSSSRFGPRLTLMGGIRSLGMLTAGRMKKARECYMRWRPPELIVGATGHWSLFGLLTAVSLAKVARNPKQMRRQSWLAKPRRVN